MTLNKKPSDATVVVAGASGYIGKFAVAECVSQGYNTIALSRKPMTFPGAENIVVDVTDKDALARALQGKQVDSVISCLASRSGSEAETELIDYQATLNCLEAGVSNGMAHFVLLSAYCVQKPLLQLQQKKLKFENALIKMSEESGGKIGYSIVRPTAFFKSVSGQLEVVQNGLPFVVFGDGTMCKCNPIAEGDLARYMVDCITDKSRNNRILNLGGPDEGYTMQQQGELLADVLGVKPNIVKAPVGLFDAIIGGLEWVGGLVPSFKDAAELARIGKYYAVEDMLTTAPEEKYGTMTLRQHYEKIAVEGQEYDPFTSILGGGKKSQDA
ncbi:unnamed protein product [Chrysoparadoxa australica]